MRLRLALVSLSLFSAAALLNCSDNGPHAQVLDPGNIPDASFDATLDAAADAHDADDKDTTPPFVGDAGPPGLVTSTQTIDFAQVGCGKSSAPISFAIDNMGSVPFNWTSTLQNGGTSLFATIPSAGTVAPGASQTVVVSMTSNVPFPGNTAIDFYADSLTIKAVGGSGTTSQAIAIHLTGKGAILRFSPTSIDFGDVPLNFTPTASFNVINDGNAPAEVALNMSNPRFSRSPLGPVNAAGGATVALQASFSATDTVAQLGSLMMAATANPNNSFCADLPTAGLQLNGRGTNGTAAVSPTSISFGSAGRVDCGSQATSQPLTITNTGNAPFNFTATLTSGGGNYVVSPASGTVQANSNQVVQVIPNPIPQTSAITPELYSATISVTTTASNDSAHIVQLHETARGVILASTLGGQTLAFGGVAVGQSASSQFSVTNSGNVATTISLTNGSSAFTITPSFPIAASQSVAPNVTFQPSAFQPYTDTALMTVPGGTVLCGAMPGNITLTGTGTNAVSAAPASLNFGSINCGLSAAAQTVTLANSGPALTFIATLGQGVNSAFTISPSSGSLAGGGPDAGSPSVTITVTPKQVPAVSLTTADGFADTLTIKTDSPGDSPHVIALHETAQGAIMVFNPISIAKVDPPPAMAGHVTFNPFSVVNNGNLTASFTLAFTQDPTGKFSSNLNSGTLVGGASTNGTISMTLGSGQTLNAIKMTIPVGTVLCADVPPDMQLSDEP